MPVNLLSPNDLAQLRKAMEDCREIQLERSLGSFSQQISTVPAAPVWGCAMLVRMEKQYGHIYTTQYFKSVEQMEESL